MLGIILYHSSTLYIEVGSLNQTQLINILNLASQLCGSGDALPLSSEGGLTSGLSHHPTFTWVLGPQTPICTLAQPSLSC